MAIRHQLSVWMMCSWCNRMRVIPQLSLRECKVLSQLNIQNALSETRVTHQSAWAMTGNGIRVAMGAENPFLEASSFLAFSPLLRALFHSYSFQDSFHFTLHLQIHKCSVNPRLFHCGFSLFKDIVQQPGPLSAHTNPLCKVEKRSPFLQANTAMPGCMRG